MSRKKTLKKESNLGLLYALFIIAFVGGITLLVLSVFAPKKRTSEPEMETASNTVVNRTELEQKQQQNTDEKTNISDDQVENTQTPSQYEKVEKTNPNELDISITKNEVANGNYQLRIVIYELLTQTGSCELEMKTSNGDYVKKTVNTINSGADSSSCEGFDVPTSGISSGTYNFTVNIKAGTKTGKVSGTIKI